MALSYLDLNPRGSVRVLQPLITDMVAKTLAGLPDAPGSVMIAIPVATTNPALKVYQLWFAFENPGGIAQLPPGAGPAMLIVSAEVNKGNKVAISKKDGTLSLAPADFGNGGVVLSVMADEELLAGPSVGNPSVPDGGPAIAWGYTPIDQSNLAAAQAKMVKPGGGTPGGGKPAVAKASAGSGLDKALPWILGAVVLVGAVALLRGGKKKGYAQNRRRY